MTAAVDVMPPHDELAEQAVLGAAMSSPRALADALDTLVADDFWLQRNRFVFDAITTLAENGTGVDPVTVQAELDRRGKPAAGAYVLDLFQGVPTARNIAHYAKIVADKAVLRRLSEAGQRAQQIALSPAGEAAEAVELIRQEFDRVAATTRRATEVHAIDDLAASRIDAYHQPADTALATGWTDLDKALTGGLRPGTLTVIAARPGVGKSVLGGNLATAASLAGNGVLFASLEMTRDELTDRILASLAKVELSTIAERMLTEHDHGRLRTAADKLTGAPLRIVDIPHLGITGLRTLSRDLTRTVRGLSLIIVDYLQLMRPADPRAPRQEQVATLSRGLKLLAKELSVPVVALAQLNRGPEQRADKRPAVADLRESGSIEADADAVLLLHVDPAPEKSGEIEVIIGKNRHGRQCSVHLAWAPYYARAGNLTRHLEAV